LTLQKYGKVLFLAKKCPKICLSGRKKKFEKKKAKKFGGNKKSPYICTVIKMTTPLSAGSKTVSPLLQFDKATSHWGGFSFLIEPSEDSIESGIGGQSPFHRNSFVPLVD